MGYDMYLRGEVPGEAEAVKAAEEAFNEAVALRDALGKEAAGSWFTPEEEALPEEERNKIGTERNRAVDHLVNKEGLDFFEARRRVQGVPATEEYLRRQEAVERASDEAYAARKSYFRLNIWGMSACCELMQALGMLKPAARKPWPEQKEYGLDNDEVFEYLMERWHEHSKEPEGFVDFLTTNSADQPDVPTFTDVDVEAFLRYNRAVETLLSQHDENVPGIGANKFDSNDGWIVTPAECEGALRIWGNLPQHVRDRVIAEKSWWLSWLEFLANGAKHDGFAVY